MKILDYRDDTLESRSNRYYTSKEKFKSLTVELAIVSASSTTQRANHLSKPCATLKHVLRAKPFFPTHAIRSKTRISIIFHPLSSFSLLIQSQRSNQDFNVRSITVDNHRRVLARNKSALPVKKENEREVRIFGNVKKSLRDSLEIRVITRSTV